jgi:ferrous iron transport protein B
VEKMTGRYSYDGLKVEIVDLPGTYSLTSYSLEERVTRGFLLEKKPSIVVNVADAANLTLQLLEMEIPLVMDLNMMDVADRRGIRIDSIGLSKQLGVPVVETVMKTGRGKDELLSSISRTARDRAASGGMGKTGMRMGYGPMEPFLFM